ncbi:MAG: class I SAM-dependent methyltransferase, partial [Gemmataceae bacterium]
LAEAGLRVQHCEVVTDNEVLVSRRWHDARQARQAELVQLEGEPIFAGLQRFLSTVHSLTSTRRLSRFVYLGVRA